MKKIILNRCHGGFSLTKEAVELGRKLSGKPNWLNIKNSNDGIQSYYLYND